MEPIKFTCPACAARHNRGHVDGVDLFRCMRCGYVGKKNAYVPSEPLPIPEPRTTAWERLRGRGILDD